MTQPREEAAVRGARRRLAWRLSSEPEGYDAPAWPPGVGRRARTPVVLDLVAGSMLVQFLRAPALVGGIVPSSAALARAMSRHARGFEAIVELGSGTGAVTRRLAAEHPRAALTVIEREERLAQRVAGAFPRARVRIGCVHERVDDLMAQPKRAVAVSSLPFRSLPDDVAATTIAAIERFLLDHPERRLVQYSYGLRAPFAFRDARIAWRRVERVWRNVPPAIVWVAGAPPG